MGNLEASSNRGSPAGRATSLDEAAYSLRGDAEGGLQALQRRLAKLGPWYAHFLRPWLPVERASPMLDVPSGAGNLLYALHSLGYTAVRGVDGDAGQVTLARQLGLSAEVGDAFEAVERAATGQFARIFSLDFLEHVSPEDAVRFCRAARAALAPGGILLCRTPSADGPFGSHDRYNDVTHRWAMTAGSAVQLLSLAGFKPSEVVVVGEPPVPYNLVNRVRLGMYQLTTAALGGWLHVCGIGRPVIWTRSMWIVASVGQHP